MVEGVRQVVAEAWAFRWRVELDAELRFKGLAADLACLGEAALFVDLASQASLDEHRHAGLCEQLALAYGHPALRGTEPAAPLEIAPRGLPLRLKVLYELVAACCITETESMSTLVRLLEDAKEPQLATALRELAKDEVGHSRLGWAYLARGHSAEDLAFLGPRLPGMLHGTATDALFEPASADREAAELTAHGVLPHSLKREVFARTLEDVVFPGLESLGVDTGPARRWLATRWKGVEAR